MTEPHTSPISYSILQPFQPLLPFSWSACSLSASSHDCECIYEGILITHAQESAKLENYYMLTLNHLLVCESLECKEVSAGLPLRNPHLKILPGLGFSLCEHKVSYAFYCTSPDSFNSWIKELKRVCVCLDFDDYYAFDSLLGKGSFSKVYLGIKLKDDENYAIKVIKKNKLSENIKNIKALIKEIEIMRKTNHPRIVRLYEVYETESCIYLVTEYLEGGELLQRMRSNGHCSEKDATIVIKCVLEALEHCHERNIVHRDLKLENLILV
eukprot:TRINITY_DN1182_c0_g1_i10.p1 TRINITY_DN1182_c0_g1~~TRINITY_DN1182_c0_g1_i10.p1  ORF type:complete len:269 (-),score=40.65 TRINITY_DN1182_c0_g1_i10:1145-1951(-)